MRCGELLNPGCAAVVDVEHMDAVVDIGAMLGMVNKVNMVDGVDGVEVLDVVDLAVCSAAAGPCGGAAVHLARPWGPSPRPSCSSGSGRSSPVD